MYSLALLLRKKEKNDGFTWTTKAKAKRVKIGRRQQAKGQKRKKATVFSRLRRLKVERYTILKSLMTFIHLE